MNKTIIKKVLGTTLLASIMIHGSSANVYATAGYAYSMGGLFTSVQQVIDTADNWALCGYSSYYNTDIVYSYLGNSSVLNSSVVYMSGPGSQTRVKLENNLYFTSGTCNGTTEVGVTNYTLSQTKLYVFNASKTAYGTSNLCTATRTHGAKAVLGWVDTITATDSTKWEQRFQAKCVSGYSLNSAIIYADSFTDYGNNMSIKSHVIYGNYGQTITWSGSSSVGNEQDRGVDDREVSIDEIECSYDNIDEEAIADTISAYAPEFDMSDYEINAVSTSEDNTSFVVDVTKKVGDFSTSSGYTFIFHDEKADVMYDNTIDSRLEFSRSSVSVKSANADTNADTAYEIAARGIDEGYYITDQFVTKYYDVETGSFYNKVYTECKEIDGDCYYSYSTLVPVA